MSGIDDVKSTLRRRRESAFVLIDQSPIDRFHEADRALAAAIERDDTLGTSADVQAAQMAVDAAREAMEAAQVEFVFEGIGRQAWTEMSRRHEATPQQQAATPGQIFNDETFPIEALPASCVNRELTAEDAVWLYENLDEGEWGKLWGACLTANFGSMVRPKSEAASALRPASVLSWLTAAREESPEPSSLAE